MSNLDSHALLPNLSSEPAPSRAARLLSRGNSLRLARGGATFACGASGAFLLMAQDGRFRFGVPFGALLVSVAAIGVMDLLGTFDDDVERRATTTSLGAIAWPLARAALTALLFSFALWGAVQGIVGQALAGALVTATFIACVASVFALVVALGPFQKDENGEERSLLRRHGFWLLVACALLYLPTLGNASLWDPWETHYGEVSREILARDDWISTWWGWEGWFFSKPILSFWMQAIAMATLGVGYAPDKMLTGVHGALAHPEWAVRAPTTLFAMLAAYVLYKGVARHFGRRAGLLGALALATMPQWFFLAHQSMTDMPFVAAMSCAIGLMMMALATNDETRVRVYQVTAGHLTLRLSAWHLVFGAVLVVAMAQILYLVTRNLELVLHATGAHGFRPHMDELYAGSAGGNCALPGNPACGSRPTTSHFEPWMQALVWTGTLACLLAANWGERRAKRLLYLGAWFFVALATMVKGPAGLVLTAASMIVYVCATRRWSEIPRLEIGSGLLMLGALVLPWLVAMYVRHGSAFTDELFFHDMYNRAFDHVHDTNDGADTSFTYYVWQLGYALFPWTGFAPLGLLFWCRQRAGNVEEGATPRRQDVSILLLAWFLLTFGLFSVMGTKFHHYIFPAVPPAAMLIGITLDRMLGRSDESGASAPDAYERAMLGAACIGAALVCALVGRDLASTASTDQPGPIHLLQLFTYQYHRGWPGTLDLHTPILVFTIAAVSVIALMSIAPLRKHATRALLVVAFAWAAWGLDSYMPQAAPHWGQRTVIEAYYTHRASEDEPLVAYRLNWKGENFYTSNRIAQFVQTGGAPLATWLKDQRGKGTQFVYVVTEQSQLAGMKKDVGAKSYTEITQRADSNQFVLVKAEL